MRAMPLALASRASFSLLRPTRMGSGKTLSPLLRRTPPWARMAMIERTRCWLVPMRPVTPFMMMPSRLTPMTLSDPPSRRSFSWGLARAVNSRGCSRRRACGPSPCEPTLWGGSPGLLAARFLERSLGTQRLDDFEAQRELVEEVQQLLELEAVAVNPD